MARLVSSPASIRGDRSAPSRYRPFRANDGGQKLCYLLGEGYVNTFRELMDYTDWDLYGTGNYHRCADCMAHCGYEATAVADMVRKLWKGLKAAISGIKTQGDMAPEIPLENAQQGRFRVRKSRRRSAAPRRSALNRRRRLRRGFTRCLRRLNNRRASPPPIPIPAAPPSRQ